MGFWEGVFPIEWVVVITGMRMHNRGSRYIDQARQVAPRPDPTRLHEPIKASGRRLSEAEWTARCDVDDSVRHLVSSAAFCSKYLCKAPTVDEVCTELE